MGTSRSGKWDTRTDPAHKATKGLLAGHREQGALVLHTGQLKGISNRIKVIKRMAYVYRDSESLFMKIKCLSR